MANQFDEFTKNLAERSSQRGSLMSLGANVIGAAVATLTSAKEDSASKYAEVCAGYTGVDYETCVKTAEWRDRSNALPGADAGVRFNAVSSNGGVRFNAVAANGVRFNAVSSHGGVRFNAVASNGVRFNAVSTAGVRFNAVAANGVRFNAVSSHGVRFNAVSARAISPRQPQPARSR
jgi:urease beta subunit